MSRCPRDCLRAKEMKRFCIPEGREKSIVGKAGSHENDHGDIVKVGMDLGERSEEMHAGRECYK